VVRRLEKVIHNRLRLKISFSGCRRSKEALQERAQRRTAVRRVAAARQRSPWRQDGAPPLEGHPQLLEAQDLLLWLQWG
jgi:hypothetical protein